MIDFQSVNGWYKNSFGEDSFGGFSRGILSGIIAPRPAGPYPDISLAGKNPMSVALTERHHKSQDNYLLGKNRKHAFSLREMKPLIFSRTHSLFSSAVIVDSCGFLNIINSLRVRDQTILKTFAVTTKIVNTKY